MWIFNEDGFFSVVNVKGNKNQVLIRARKDADLDRLLDRLDAPDDEVIQRFEDKTSDYHYRLILTKPAFQCYLKFSADDMAYETDIKGHIDQDEEDRHHALVRVWSAMAEIQPEAPWVGLPRDTTDEDELAVMRAFEADENERLSYADAADLVNHLNLGDEQ